MSEKLLSVGLDVGTTSTQLIVSEIAVQNRASGFAVPEMDITGRTVLYESPVFFTPLAGENLVDGDAIARLVRREYEKAGITPERVDTGAVIVTGETSRKENAGAVLQALSGLAGDFVVATAGPDLESILAAKGAGAVDFSERTGKPVLHMDIGGGTSNLCYIRDGKITATGCLNVGGRLVKVERGKISYVSPVLQALWSKARYGEGIAAPECPLAHNDVDGRMEVGQIADVRKLEALADTLVQALEMAAGLREVTPLWEALWTRECGRPLRPESKIPASPAGPAPLLSAARTFSKSTPYTGETFREGQDPPLQGEWVISFSGGVADCIEKELDSFAFGDMGPILGRAIRKSRLCQGEFMLGVHTIRATVIGAGCHSAQLSGSTVFCQNVSLPMKNLPVAVVSEEEQTNPQIIARRLGALDGESVVLAVPGFPSPGYEQVKRLADALLEGFRGRELLVCVEQDMAKALGQRLGLLLGAETPCLCIDRVRLSQGSYLDVGKPMGPCMPVVVKTLVLSN